MTIMKEKNLFRPRSGLRKSATGFKGVTFNGKGFKAEIYKDGKRIYIGQFETAIEAAIAWDQKAIALFGPRTDLNFGMPRGDHR